LWPARRRVGSGGPWVLVTDDLDGQNRSALAAVRALAAGGYRPAVTVSGSRSLAAASRHCLRAVQVPRPGAAGYAEAVQRLARTGEFLTVLPASDAALVALSGPSAQLVDKDLLAARAATVGLRVPVQQTFRTAAELLAAARDLDYPIVVKPAVKLGAGQMPARRVTRREQLSVFNDAPGQLVVQPYEPGPVRAVCGVVSQGRLLAAVHQRYLRTWPPECGVAAAAETVRPDREAEEQLVALLLGHQGVFQAQFVGGYLIDVNPRVYGSLPLAVAAGANLAAIACDAAQGREHEIVRARPGVAYRWREGDVRALAWSVRNGRMTPAAAARELLPVRRAAHSVESLRDPVPLLVRLAHAAHRGIR
jgi:predicted ATP-grasp superfamily ATP-dependent carboligase